MSKAEENIPWQINDLRRRLDEDEVPVFTQETVNDVCECFKKKMSNQCANQIFGKVPDNSKIVVVGSLYGDFGTLKRILKEYFDALLKQHINEAGDSEKVYLVFMGNYIEHNSDSVSTIVMVMLIKVLFPTYVFLLRGETELPNTINPLMTTRNFAKYCAETYSDKKKAEAVYTAIIQTFDYFPITLRIGENLFMSGSFPTPGGSTNDMNDTITSKQILPLTQPTFPLISCCFNCASRYVSSGFVTNKGVTVFSTNYIAGLCDLEGIRHVFSNSDCFGSLQIGTNVKYYCCFTGPSVLANSRGYYLISPEENGSQVVQETLN